MLSGRSGILLPVEAVLTDVQDFFRLAIDMEGFLVGRVFPLLVLLLILWLGKGRIIWKGFPCICISSSGNSSIWSSVSDFTFAKELFFFDYAFFYLTFDAGNEIDVIKGSVAGRIDPLNVVERTEILGGGIRSDENR